MAWNLATPGRAIRRTAGDVQSPPLPAAHNADDGHPKPHCDSAPAMAKGTTGSLPGLALVATLLVMGLTGRHDLFNLSTRDTVLVAGIGSVLIGLVLSLTIVCIILIRSMR